MTFLLGHPQGDALEETKDRRKNLLFVSLFNPSSALGHPQGMPLLVEYLLKNVSKGWFLKIQNSYYSFWVLLRRSIT